MWEVELSGEALDIETLRPLASAIGATIAPGPDGRYCLGGATFANLATADEARAHAGEMLVRLNGAALLDDPQHRLVQTGTSVYDRRRNKAAHHHVFIEVGVAARVKVGTTAFVFSPPGAFDMPPSIGGVEPERRVLTDPRLAKILEAVAADKITWQRLRVAFELIVNLVGGKGGKYSQCLINNGYATDKEIVDFKKNTDDPRHSGMNAVHGVPTGPLKGRKMTERQGLAFIGRLVRTYLSKNSRSSEQ